MSADFNTRIQMKGTNEELFAMVMVLKKMEKEMYDQYNKERNCAYLKHVNINGVELSPITDDQIKEIIESSNGTISVGATGPYGVFCLLNELPLFENMAEAAPNAYFDGLMEGFDAGGDQSRKGVLENKKLHVYTMYPDDDGWDDDGWDDDEDSNGWDGEAIYDPITKKWD